MFARKCSKFKFCIAFGLGFYLSTPYSFAVQTNEEGKKSMSTTTTQSKTIPKKITTPDVVNTRIGTLKFFDGFPTDETVEKLYDNLDFMRGVECFLNFVPMASLEGLRRGFADVNVDQCNKVVIFDELMDSNPLFLTGNTDTVYAGAMLDLERDGPTVIEVPPNCGPGTVNDAYFRFVTDMGIPGPDAGKGGKYLVLPPDYSGETPDGYFVSTSTSYTNLLLLRGFLVDGKTEAATKNFKEGLKIYPLAKKDSTPNMEFINGSRKVFNTIHANDYSFYEEIDTVFQKEPVSLLDPELRGLAASIGIEKGKKFAPDAQMRKTLTEAAAVGNGTARAIAFKFRDKNAYFYEGSNWYTGFVGGDYKWLKDEGKGGRNLDARTFFFYIATINTPAMVKKMVGKGSQYALAVRSKDGNYLDGSKTYKLNIPANVPAKDFWSLVVYDPQSRSELRTSQPFPSKNSKRSNLVVNKDGSTTVYFGPKSPEGKEQNWIETVPEKGWMVLLRLYGPLEPWFDKTWKPGEIEALD